MKQTGPIKNVKDMLSGLQLADTPRTKSTNREVVNKVTQSIKPVPKLSLGASTKKAPMC